MTEIPRRDGRFGTEDLGRLERRRPLHREQKNKQSGYYLRLDKIDSNILPFFT